VLNDDDAVHWFSWNGKIAPPPSGLTGPPSQEIAHRWVAPRTPRSSYIEKNRTIQLFCAPKGQRSPRKPIHRLRFCPFQYSDCCPLRCLGLPIAPGGATANVKPSNRSRIFWLIPIQTAEFIDNHCWLGELRPSDSQHSIESDRSFVGCSYESLPCLASCTTLIILLHSHQVQQRPKLLFAPNVVGCSTDCVNTVSLAAG